MLIHSRQKPYIIAHDEDWQFPAITEQHAYRQVKKNLWHVPGICYLGFPWATLIDQLNTNVNSSKNLMKKLAALMRDVKPETRVVTVCQHIHMLKFKDVFIDHGITDIFWTHAIKGQSRINSEREIRIHPFPLFPVQFQSRYQEEEQNVRKYLFSFIGARANKWYLTESRNWILDILGGDDRGLVMGRDQWHYNSVVYDFQIKKKKKTDKNLVDESASEQFREVLKRSVFSLCPSGSGPNSIRLWESIGAGSIPVILADNYAPPGPSDLWEQAAVFCKETPEDIKALPDRLEAIASDETLLAHKRKMLTQLWSLYGTESFIYDIQKLYIDVGNSKGLRQASTCEPGVNSDRLSSLSKTILSMANPEKSDLEFFLNACTSRILINEEGFYTTLDSCTDTKLLLARALSESPENATLNRFKALHNFPSSRRPKTTLTNSNKNEIKQRLKVCLHGPHSNRTPMAYDVYRPHFAEIMDFVTEPKHANIAVTGFNKDLNEARTKFISNGPSGDQIQVAVISEEPLWDSVWSKGYLEQSRQASDGAKRFGYDFLNHMNSNIFNFDKIPYFLTTADDYFVRYSNMFRRNSTFSIDELIENWRNAEITCAFFAENRIDERYEVSFPKDGVFGLSTFRTKLAAATTKGNVVRVGSGWENTNKTRQKLPDWHLDKLTTLDKASAFVSGLENTHQKNYITEKIFDAFAVLAIPLYYASPNHKIHETIAAGSFINLYGKTVDAAVNYLEDFEPTREFAANYLATQLKLADLFSNVETLVNERKRVVTEIYSSLNGHGL